LASLKLRRWDLALDLAVTINLLLWKRGSRQTATLKTLFQGKKEQHVVGSELIEHREMTAIIRLLLTGTSPNQIDEIAVRTEMERPSLGARPYAA
jgi:hypothetical protein